MSPDSRENEKNLDKKGIDALSGIYGESKPAEAPVQGSKTPQPPQKPPATDRSEAERLKVLGEIFEDGSTKPPVPTPPPPPPPPPPKIPFFTTPAGIASIVAVVVVIACIAAVVIFNPFCIMGCGNNTTPVTPTQNATPETNTTNTTPVVVPAPSGNETVNLTPAPLPVTTPPNGTVLPPPGEVRNGTIPNMTPVNQTPVPSQGLPPQTPAPGVTPTPAPNVTSTPAPAAVTPAPYKAPDTTLYTPEQVNKHFINVVFGNDRAQIDKFKDPVIYIALSGNASGDAQTHIGEFSRIFNDLSSYSTIPLDTFKSDNANINLKFLNTEGMTNIADPQKYKQITDPDTKKPAIIYWDQSNTKYIYLNTDLDPARTKHYLVRGLLIGLGFYGETPQYPDSIFYARNTTSSELSDLDKAAVQIMYGQKIKNQMTLDDVKKVLVI